MKPHEINFKANVYEDEKMDLIDQNHAHDYRHRLVGTPNEIEHIVKLMKRVLAYCNRMTINNNHRWEKLQDIFIFDKRGHKLWSKIRDRDYPHHITRTNQALRDEMIPKMLDEILSATHNAEQIYKYCRDIKCNLDRWEAVRWTDRLQELYDLGDEMTAVTRPSALQRVQYYMDSMGSDMMDEVTNNPTMTDILDDANQNANPKSMGEIATVISNIQRKKNKEKGLFLNEEGDMYEKKNGGGGASGGRGNGNGSKRGGSFNNNNQSNKKKRHNHQNTQQQGGNNFDNRACALPGHGSHKWKQCRLNYRNKDNYNHEAAVRMAERDGVPDWFKGQVERSTSYRSNNGGNNNGGNGNQSHQNNHSHYQHNYNSQQQGGPPPFNYHYQQQQQPPYQSHNYMQLPPPPSQQPARGPGRNGPPPPSGPPSVLSNYSTQQEDAQAVVNEYPNPRENPDEAGAVLQVDCFRCESQQSVGATPTRRMSPVLQVDLFGCESQQCAGTASTPEMSYVLEEQDYSYGPGNCYTFSNDDLQEIYAAHCQSEVESYVAHLGVATLRSQVESLRRSTAEYAGYDFFTMEEMFMENYVQDCSAETYAATWQDEFAYNATVEDQEYLFEVVEEEDVLDPVNIIKGPDVVMTTGADGTCIPLAMVIVQVRSIQGKGSARYLKALLDTGSNISLAHSRILPSGTKMDQLQERKLVNTAAGPMAPNGQLTIDGIHLPEFDRNAVIETQQFQVFSAECRFDLILGMDFLTKAGVDIFLSTLEVSAFGVKLPMSSQASASRMSSLIDSTHVDDDIDFIGDDVFTTQISDAKYEEVNLTGFVAEYCTHLLPSQREQLLRLLIKHKKLFDGSLGRFDDEEMDIELQPNARPVWKRPYPVPHKHLEVFRKELNHLVEIGVLAPAHGATEWALPTFIIPKKPEPGTGIQRVRWVSDLRELNKVIVRKNYPLPVITDVLRKHHGYQFATCLDLSMQFYCFKLSERAQNIAVINTPFGLYKYLRAPMGLANTPSFAQAKMEQTLADVPDVDCYIDDVGIFSKTWEEHLETLAKVLDRLECKGFTCNPVKCLFGVKEMEWLGYIVTPEGLKPNPKKVEAILNMQRPRNAGELRSFLGLVNFYRDLFPRRSHLLQSFYDLTNSTDKRTVVIPWTSDHDRAFQELKAVVAKDAIMAFPNHRKPFHIYTDASDKQLGACIMQEGRPVAYYSKKLNPAQMNYSTMEKELLALVMTLKEYRTMLLGAELHCYTDHKNLSFANLNSQRVMRWRAFVEEYTPKIYYLAGKLNVVADAYSRLPRFDGLGAVEGTSGAAVAAPQELDYTCAVESLLQDDMFCEIDDPRLLDVLSYYTSPEENFVYLNCPATDRNPLRYQWLADSQSEDQQLLQKCNDAQNPNYQLKNFKDIDLCSYCKEPNDPNEHWKIVLTDETLNPTIEFYHKLLNHPGHNALEKALHLYYHPELSARIRAFACHDCQFTKAGTRGIGHLPPRDVSLDVWQQVDVDLIGPWSFELRGGKTVDLFALTCIDRASGYPAAKIIARKTSEEVAHAFEACWLALFPKPEVCGSDNGGEFIGPEFQELLFNWAISHACTTARNPAGNGIVERMHLTIGNSLRVLLKDNICQTQREAHNLLERALSAALHSVRCNVSESTSHSPGEMVFQRNMLHNIKMEINIDQINERRQLRVIKDAIRANAKRYAYDYKVGDLVLKKVYIFKKLDERWVGPYSVTQVHVNGNLSIQLRPGVIERINIRRIKPYKTPTTSTL